MTPASTPAEPATRSPLDQARSAVQKGDGALAWKSFHEALATDSKCVPALVGISRLEMNAGRMGPARAWALRARDTAPAEAEAWQQLVLVHLRSGDTEGAEGTARAALRAVDKPTGALWAMLAESLRVQHRNRETIDALEQHLALEPGLHQLDSGLVFQRNYFEWPPRIEFERCRQWDERHARALRPATPDYPHDRNPDRRLRIGYVSPDFRWHAVAHFAQPVFAAHDHANFEIFCYAAHKRGDLNSRRFAGMADQWVPVHDLTDDAFAERIRADRIDVLVDLAGHSGGNRLLVFARRPAPVQATWLGYCNTTGLSAMDYRIVDPITDPPGLADETCVEKLERLPRGFHSFGPPEENPPVRPAPAPANGFVTFGSFNNSAKHTEEVLALWSGVLRAVPGSRLLLKSGQYANAPVKLWFLRQFAAHGIEAGRIRLVPSTPSSSEHYSSFGLVDVALDPFPYNGTTTTCDALWMGVPVVTLEGRVHRSRVGCSLLRQIGRSEWIARDPAEYVAIAARLAGDAQAGRFDRTAVREAMRKSSLCDATGLARDLENAYRGMWRRWLG